MGDRIEEARTFRSRLRGLIGRRDLASGEGLLLRRTRAIHMCLMRFPIDAIFLDGEGRVMAVYEGLRPWRDSAAVRGARDVLEVPTGTAAATGTKTADELEIREVDAGYEKG